MLPRLRALLPFALAWLVLTPSTRAAAQAGATTAAASASATTLPSPFAALGLTDAQRAQVKALTAATQANRAAILSRFGAGTTLSATDRVELHRLATAHNDAVRALLTAAQRATLDAHVRDVQEIQRARYARRRGGSATRGGR